MSAGRLPRRHPGLVRHQLEAVLFDLRLHDDDRSVDGTSCMVRFGTDGQPPGLDLREIEHFVHEAQQVLLVPVDAPDGVELPGSRTARRWSTCARCAGPAPSPRPPRPDESRR